MPYKDARKNQFKSEAVIKECEHQLQLLALEFPHYEGQIDSVLEELKYSEKTMCVEEDKQLLKETKFLHMLLSEENEEEISKKINT